MSRVFTDGDFRTWETYLSGGKFGLPDRPKIIFNCLSDQDRRARYVYFEGGQAHGDQAVAEMPEDRLREMLGRSVELD